MEIGKLAMECHNIGAHIGLFILTRALKWIFNYFIIIFKKKKCAKRTYWKIYTILYFHKMKSILEWNFRKIISIFDINLFF